MITSSFIFIYDPTNDGRISQLDTDKVQHKYYSDTTATHQKKISSSQPSAIGYQAYPRSTQWKLSSDIGLWVSRTPGTSEVRRPYLREGSSESLLDNMNAALWTILNMTITETKNADICHTNSGTSNSQLYDEHQWQAGGFFMEKETDHRLWSLLYTSQGKPLSWTEGVSRGPSYGRYYALVGYNKQCTQKWRTGSWNWKATADKQKQLKVHLDWQHSASQGGVCHIIGTNCCTYIPDVSDDMTHVVSHLNDLLHRKSSTSLWRMALSVVGKPC